jgi:hypothetical protein
MNTPRLVSISTMKKLKTTKLIAIFSIGTWENIVFAHDGHGFSGAHWHATDAWGFVALGGMVALAIWLSRNGK